MCAYTLCLESWSRGSLSSLSQPGWGWGQSGHQPWQGEHWSLWQMQPLAPCLHRGPARYPVELSLQSSCPLYPILSLILLHHREGVCSTASLGASGTSQKGSRNLFCSLFGFFNYYYYSRKRDQAQLVSNQELFQFCL